MKKNSEKEKGVALLLALGFAALLLVLIMGFATNALIERKVASNIGDKMEAKAIAKSAVNRAVAAMQYQIEIQKTNGDRGLFRFDNIVSKTSDGVMSDTEIADMFTKINDRHFLCYRPDIYLYEYPLGTADYNYNDSSVTDPFVKYRKPQWQDVVGDDGLLVGRFMYAVLPDLGKVYIKSGEDIAERYGRDMKDFDEDFVLGGITDAAFEDSPMLIRVKMLKDNSFKMEAGNIANWPKIKFFLYGIENDSDIAGAVDNNVRNYKFISDAGTFDSEMQYIFNIPQNVEDVKIAVPALAKMSAAEAALVENQLAANLIEAFNPNVSASVIADSTTNPTYSGNRRSPYLNEFEISLRDLKVNVAVDLHKDTDGNIVSRDFTLTPEVGMRFSAELYDPYKCHADFSSGFDLAHTGKFQLRFYLRKGDTVGTGGTGGTWEDIGFATVNLNNAGEMTKNLTIDGTTYYHQLTFDTVNPFKQSNVDKIVGVNDDYYLQVRVVNLPPNWILKSGANNIDYVTGLTLPESEMYYTATLKISKDLETSTLVESSGNNIRRDIVYQVKDARVNLKPEEWQINTAVIDNAVESNIGKRNDKCILGISAVDATADDNLGFEIPEYFPNLGETKASLADLAYISRGIRGETFKIFNKDAKDILLLDQLTAIEKTVLPQLIDINTRSIYVWHGLLSNIKDVDGKYIFSTDSGLTQNNTSVMDVALQISKYFRANKTYLKTRSDFVKAFDTALGSAGVSLTNTQKSIVLGRIMSLCKVEDYPEYIYMAVAAQSVIDNQSDASNKGKFDDGDTVTSEIKYLIKLHRDKDNNIKVISMEELLH